MKPLFNYYGSKAKLAKWICSLMPIDYECYVEPFCGSAAVFFAKEKSPVEVLNDHTEDLVNVYRMMQNFKTSRELWRRILYTPYSRSEFEKAGKILRSKEGSPIDRAWAYLIESSMSHGSVVGKKTQSGMVSISLVNQNSPGPGTRGAFSIQRGTAGKGKDAQWADRDRIRKAAKRLTGVVLEKMDAHEVIETWDSPKTLFYLDPPYPGSDQGHYDGYTHEDLENLVELLETIKGSFLLSNYDQDYVPKDWERFEKDVTLMVANRNGAKKQKRTEVVWRKLNEFHSQQPALFQNTSII